MVSLLEKQLNTQKTQESKIGIAKLVNGVLVRKSLLFDSREIMTVTKEMAFLIGKKGLSQLSKIDPIFDQFEETIFSETSKHFQYYTQDSESRTKIQLEINNFLILLSPFTMISAAMYALEWLIYQFHIEELCWHHLIHSILPYHDTKLFSRIIQLVDFDSMKFGEKRLYSFLKSVQKEAVPLPKKSLVSHVIRNPGLLVAVSNYIKNVNQLLMSISSNQFESFSVIYSFYASLAYASIDGKIVNTDNNVHIRNQLLYNVIDGLTSEIGQIRSTNVIIFSKIIEHTELSEQQLNFVITKLLKLYHMDCVNLHLLIRLSQTHPQYIFPPKICKLIIKTNSIEVIHQLSREKDTSGIGIVFLNSIDNFLQLNEESVPNRLAKLFFGWKIIESLMIKLIDHLISAQINTQCESSKKLLIELEKFAPSIVVDCIGKRLSECRHSVENTSHYQILYELLSACLTKGEGTINQATSIDLPLLLCVYNSNNEIRKSAVYGLRDFLLNNVNLPSSTQLKLKDIIEFLIYKNPSDIVLLVLNELQPLPIFSDLFDSIERVTMFQHIMECLLSSPEKWVDAMMNVSAPQTQTQNENYLDIEPFKINHALMLDMLTVIIMILHQCHRNSSSSNDQIFKIIHFAGCLLPADVVNIFSEELKDFDFAISTTYSFLTNALKAYINKFNDGFIEFIMRNFMKFKTLTKYTAICAIGILGNINNPLSCYHDNNHDEYLEYDFLSNIIDELQLVDIPSLISSNHMSNSSIKDIKSIKNIESWEDVISCMDVVNYPFTLIYTVKQYLSGSNYALGNTHSAIILNKSCFLAHKKLLYWLCEIHQRVDRKHLSLIDGVEFLSEFFCKSSRFATNVDRIKFVQLCLFYDYNLMSSDIFMDLFEMIWHISTTSETCVDRYMAACFVLAIQHSDKKIRQFAFFLCKSKSKSNIFCHFFNSIVDKENELINFPQKLCHHVAICCKSKKSNKVVIEVVRSILGSLLDNIDFICEYESVESLMCFVKDLPVFKCILSDETNVNLIVRFINSFIIKTDSPDFTNESIYRSFDISAQFFIKLCSETHINQLPYTNIFDDLFIRWILLPHDYSSHLVKIVTEKFFVSLPTLTLHNWAINCLDTIVNNKTIEHSQHNESLLNLLRKFPVNVSFIGNYIESDNDVTTNLSKLKLEIILELMQSKNCILNKETFLTSLFKYIDLFYIDKKFDQLQLVLNCCESILREESLKSTNIKNKSLHFHSPNINCLLPLLNVDAGNHNNKDEQPSFKLSVLNILKYLSFFDPTIVLHHLVTIFISIGNHDYDNFNTMTTIQEIIKQVLPHIVNNTKGDNNTNIEDIIVAIVEAFPHIPQHRHLTLCTILFEIIDQYDDCQRYASMFIEWVLYREPHQEKQFCIDFFYSRSIAQQLKILLHLYDYLIDISSKIKTISNSNEFKYAKKRSHASTISFTKIEFDSIEACIKHQTVVLAMAFTITQDSQNALHLNSSDTLVGSSDSDKIRDQSPIFPLLEKVYTYSHIIKQQASSEEYIKMKKLFRYIVKQCDNCINNLLNSMPLNSKLTCMMHAVSSPSDHVRRRIIDQVITVVSQSARSIAHKEPHLHAIMEIVDRLVTTSERLVISNLCADESKLEELQVSMCCIKCIIFRVFSQHGSNIKNIDSFMEQLKIVFERLFKLYDFDSQIPLTAFVTMNLAVCELASLLSVNVLSQVFPLLTVLIDLFSNRCTFQQSQNNVKLSLLWFEANVTSTGKLFSAMGNFFTSQLYTLLGCVLQSASNLVVECVTLGDNSSADIVRQFTHNLIVEKISKKTDSRVYLPVLERIVTELLPQLTNSNECFATLIELVAPTFNQHAETPPTQSNSQLLTTIYLDLFDDVLKRVGNKYELISQIIENVSEYFCDFILLHSETQSHQIISSFFQWTSDNDSVDDEKSMRNFIFFYVIDLLWFKLKSIMLLFAPIYFQYAVDFITDIENSETDEYNTKSLTNFMTTFYVVQSFGKCFNVDRSGFINNERMNAVVKPLISLIVCATVFSQNYPSVLKAINFVKETLAPTVASLTTCTKENKLFLSIQSEMIRLLKSHNSDEQIICDTLTVLEHFYAAVGDISATLLPELSPVLMEIMDDDSAKIQIHVNRLVRSIEEITGESLDRYL